jgi:eukaryotic-like serine/threonine-protein kinase
MEPLPGQNLSHYTILERLGGGGMGVVYKALDLRLKRTVALKFLPAALTRDEAAKQRFVQEAQAASSLDHPNICTIHEIDETPDGQLFLAMTFYDGETVKKYLDGTALRPDDALDFAIQVAQGLVQAHDAGIVHRDIKSANLMVTRGGLVKIVDFGLAKLLGRTDLTETGATLGTTAYMSPEQLRGAVVDRRTDIWSLGVVLFEMLTGQLPFKGNSPYELSHAIVHEQAPSVSTTRTGVPAELDRVVQRCLAQNLDERYQNAADLLAELRWLRRESAELLRAPSPAGGAPSLLSGPHSAVEPSHGATRSTAIGARQTLAAGSVTRNDRARWIAAVAALVLIVGVLAALLWRRESAMVVPRVERTFQLTREAGLEIDPAVSPDGRLIAYASGPLDRMNIYVQQIEGGRRLSLTEATPGNHRWPQWSPDGNRISFQTFKDGRTEIYFVAALGGIPRRLVEAPPARCVRGLAWSPDGAEIAYVAGLCLERSGSRDEIYVRPAGGGEARKIADAIDVFPLRWSPDGKRIAFSAGNGLFVFGGSIGPIANIAPASLWVVPTHGGQPARVTHDAYLNQSPEWTTDGKGLLFTSDRGGGRDVYQIPISASGEPSGPPVRLTTGLNVYTTTLSAGGNRLGYSVLTYRQNIWSIRIPERPPASATEAAPLTTGSQSIEGLDVSADGRWLTFDSNRSGNLDIYKMPIEGGELEQLTSDAADDAIPVWSPDGREIAFYSFRTGNRDLFVMAADGGQLRQLTNHPASDRYPDWSADGRELVFWSDRSGRDELYVISKDRGELKGETPRQVTHTGGLMPRWSPDGRLIAYRSPDAGLFVVRPDGRDARLLVPRIARIFPAWSRDSRTIYYKVNEAGSRTSFWSVPAAGGEPRLLIELDDRSRASVRSEFATDGERFYFTVTEYDSDLWLMELAR